MSLCLAAHDDGWSCERWPDHKGDHEAGGVVWSYNNVDAQRRNRIATFLTDSYDPPQTAVEIAVALDLDPNQTWADCWYLSHEPGYPDDSALGVTFAGGAHRWWSNW